MELPATLAFLFCSDDGVDALLLSWLGVYHLHGSFSLVGHVVVYHLTKASPFSSPTTSPGRVRLSGALGKLCDGPITSAIRLES